MAHDVNLQLHHLIGPRCSGVIQTHSTNSSLCQEGNLVAYSVWTDGPTKEGTPTVGGAGGLWD